MVIIDDTSFYRRILFPFYWMIHCSYSLLELLLIHNRLFWAFSLPWIYQGVFTNTIQHPVFITYYSVFIRYVILPVKIQNLIVLKNTKKTLDRVSTLFMNYSQLFDPKFSLRFH